MEKFKVELTVYVARQSGFNAIAESDRLDLTRTNRLPEVWAKFVYEFEEKEARQINGQPISDVERVDFANCNTNSFRPVWLKWADLEPGQVVEVWETVEEENGERRQKRNYTFPLDWEGLVSAISGE